MFFFVAVKTAWPKRDRAPTLSAGGWGVMGSSAHCPSLAHFSATQRLCKTTQTTWSFQSQCDTVPVSVKHAGQQPAKAPYKFKCTDQCLGEVTHSSDAQFSCHAYLLALHASNFSRCTCDSEKGAIACVCYLQHGDCLGRKPERLRDTARQTGSKNTTAEWAGLKKEEKQWLSPLSWVPLALQGCCLRMKHLVDISKQKQIHLRPDS